LTAVSDAGSISAIESRPWQTHYDSGVRPTLGEYPERTLIDYLKDSARERPDHPALLFAGNRISYAALDRLSDTFGAALVSIGVKPGDRVALMLPNTPQFVIAQFGAWKAGAIVVALNPIYTEHELKGPLANSGAETIVVLTPFYKTARACVDHTKVKRVIVTNIKEYLTPIKRLLFTLLKEKSGGHRVAVEPGDLKFADLMAAHSGQAAPAIPIRLDDPAVILLSGGTTGVPKGVLGLHRAYVSAGLQLREWIKGKCSDWQDTIMLPLPLFHVYGNVGVLGLGMCSHNTIALIPNPRDIDDLMKQIASVKPSFFTAVPTLFIALLNHKDAPSGVFKSIKICFSGAAPLLAETRDRFITLTGGTVIEGYSLTEAMMACVVNPVGGRNKIGSVGMPLPDVELVIRDGESGEPAKQGEVGEIVLRAPQAMARYWQNPEETALVLRSHGEGGPWVHTGDLGYLDPDGYLFIVDRQKDLIKTSGYQVWPREIEEVIAAHASVAEVGVAGVPDPTKGQVVWAWVVLRAGAQATTEDLRAHCKTELAPYKMPAHFEFRTSLPKTMVGKVLRRQLVAEARQAAAS